MFLSDWSCCEAVSPAKLLFVGSVLLAGVRIWALDVNQAPVNDTITSLRTVIVLWFSKRYPESRWVSSRGGMRMTLRMQGDDNLVGKVGKATMLSTVISVVLIALLVMFYAVTVNNMISLENKAAAIKNGPYPVSVEAGRVETLLVQQKTLAERATYTRSPEAIDRIEESYAQINADMSEKIALIVNAHVFDPETVQALQRDSEELSQYQAEFLTMCRDQTVTDQQVKQYVDEEFIPFVDEVLDVDRVILGDSTQAVEGLYDTVTTLGLQTIVLASVLMAAVFISLGVYLGLLAHKQKQQRRLQQNLKAALVCAQNANAAKSQFLSSMSHDIRTPMNAIVGLTTIARSHLGETRRVAECLERIAMSSRHLLCLINDVLDMGKIESGKIALNETRFNFPDTISELVAIVQPQAKAKNLILEVTLGSLEQEAVIGDSMRLNQALLNLLGNAVKYTPEGGTVCLSLSEEPGDEPGVHRYRFVVRDTGIGMSQEFLKKIFDPFERDDSNPVALEIEGTGLGMAITKNVVDMMGGEIKVESERGRGSVFTMVVPLKLAEGARDAADLVKLRGMRVLVVDDDAAVLGSALTMMEEVGLRGMVVSSGVEAVELVVEAHRAGDDFCVVVLDWMMAELDGIETARRICAEMGNAAPALVLSAYDWTDIEEAAQGAGIKSFVSKPLFKSRLCHVVQEACGLQQAFEADNKEQRQRISGRVLLAEDNELNRDIAKELIGQIGPEVEEACDGKDAVDKVLQAADGYYGLVFMDVQMPRMGGIEATQELCAEAKRSGRCLPPVIAMTASVFNEDRDRALAAGMDGFMTKPIDLKELERMLRKYL